MILAVRTRDVVTLAVEDPRAADSVALFDEMSAFVLRPYPEDDENGIVPTTTEELARDGVLVIARVGGVAAGIGALMAHAPVDGLHGAGSEAHAGAAGVSRARHFEAGAAAAGSRSRANAERRNWS